MIRTIDSGLLAAIERRIKALGVNDYVIDTVRHTITGISTDINLMGDIYFLANEVIDVVSPAQVKLSSSDNYLLMSAVDYAVNIHGTYESFRDYIGVRVENYDETEDFIPFDLVFYAIRPILN